MDPLREVIGKVESRLYRWGAVVECPVEYPGAPISGVWDKLQEYGLSAPSLGNQRSSQPERWVVGLQKPIDLVRVVNNVMRKMSELEQQVVRMRYMDRKTWGEIAEGVGVSEDYLKRSLRERILYVFALEFGLLQGAAKKPRSE